MGQARGTVLIVDDEESIRSILCRRLETEGYKCEVASDGKEALWKTFIKDFDLVLMDIKMPGTSGLEALPQMVARHPDTCVIMLTAIVDADTAVEAMKLGAYDYITKPFDLDDLIIRVEKALERRRLILENREHHLRLEQKVKQQTEQIHQYYQDAIQKLSREQIALEELESSQRSQQGRIASGEEVAAKTTESSGSVKEFTKKLTQLFGRGDSHPPERVSDAASAGVVTKGEEAQEQIVPSEDEKRALPLYRGVVELAIQSPATLQQVLQLHEHLRSIDQIKVLDIEGSVDSDVTIKLLLESPTPLSKVLEDLPGVERVSDGDDESVSILSVGQGEGASIKRMVVGLSQKPA